MNKSSLFSITIYLLAVFCMRSEQAQSQDIAGTWNGTMNMSITSNSEFGTYHCEVKLIISNNEVTGSVESTGEFIADGKTVSTTNCVGTGKGALWRVSFNDDGTYDLQAISPLFTCTHTSHIPGVPSETEQSANGLDLIANNNPIGTSRDILAGNRTEIG